ncbi:MAG: hypothetical protein ACOH1V_06975 [Stenotrophomonas sp.]
MPRKPPRIDTNEQGCSLTIGNQPINPYQTPAPIEYACVGPYLLALPQNYFSTQMGAQHDGSFSLALEYPSLEPFKPGERMNLKVDVSVRTVSVGYAYIGRMDVRQAMRNAYTPTKYELDDPAALLDMRIQGEPVYGLAPYYADLERIRAYDRRNGEGERAPGYGNWYQDWFFANDAKGNVETFIKCTSREDTNTGVEYRDGKMVKSKVRGLPDCHHSFILADHRTIVDIDYPRVALGDWARMQERARQIFMENIETAQK